MANRMINNVFRIHVLLGIVFTIAASSVCANAMEESAHYIRDTVTAHQGSPLEDSTWDIWVVTVRDVSEGKVNVDPLKLRLHVDEVLRRASEQKDELMVIWKPKPLRYAVKEIMIPGKKSSARGSSHVQPIPGPKVGDRLIVFATVRSGSDGPPYFHDHYVYRFSAENRKTVLDNMVQERSGYIQLPVFYTIIMLPMVAFFAFVVRNLKSTRQLTAKLLDIFVIFVPVIVWALYAFYKTGIDYHWNIRIDLVMMWPSLLLSLLLWPAMAIRYLLSLRSD